MATKKNKTTKTAATVTLDTASAKIAEEMAASVARMEANMDAIPTPEPVASFEEITLEIPQGAGLPDMRRRATHYEADALGLARFQSAASQAGEKVTYAPYAWGGEAHVAIATALQAAGMVPGDELTTQDLACVPGRSATQARFGSDASRATCRHRLANAGMLERVAGGKRGHTYILTEAFFNPEVWAARAAEAEAARLAVTF